MIVGSFALAIHFRHPIVYVVAWFVIGTRQHGLGVLGHEAAHWLIHPNRTLNDWIGRALCFWPILMPYGGYSVWHLVHHRHMGTDRDSELDVKHEGRFVLPTSRARLLVTFLGDLVGLGLPAMIKQMQAVRPRSAREFLLDYAPAVILLGAASAAFVANGLAIVPILWFLAMPTSFWAVFRVREFMEHTATTGTYRYHVGPVGRFVFAPHWVWAHHEHHRGPVIPCHRLLDARTTDTSVPVLSFSELLDHFAAPAFERIGLKPLPPRAGDRPGGLLPADGQVDAR
jgi:fatty acid desaturase